MTRMSTLMRVQSFALKVFAVKMVYDIRFIMFRVHDKKICIRYECFMILSHLGPALLCPLSKGKKKKCAQNIDECPRSTDRNDTL